MKNFSQLLSQAWSTVFRDQKTFWTLFLLMNGIGIILMLLFYVLGYNSAEWVNSQPISSQEGFAYGVFIVATIVLGGFFGFIGMLYLASLFGTKKVKLESVFSQWKTIFPYIGTITCIILCYIAVWFTVALIFAITFGIGYLGYIFTRGVDSEIITVIYTLASVTAFLIASATIVIAVWISVSLNAFATPAFFLDNHRYFQAPLTSKKMIAGRWWRVVGNIILASIVVMALPLALTLLEMYMNTSNIVFSLVISVVNGVAGMILLAFLFSLYIHYRENPIQSKQAVKKVKKSK